MFDGHFRQSVDKRTAPIGQMLVRFKVTANAITLSGVVLGAVAGLLIANSMLLAGLVVLVLASFGDLLDGPVAKASGGGSSKGAFLDSTSDRLTDTFIFSGLAWYFLNSDDPRRAIVPVLLLGFAQLLSYMRAKAENCGYVGKGGLMERAERMGAVAVSLLFSGYLFQGLIIVLALTVFTNVQRFIKIWRQAT